MKTIVLRSLILGYGLACAAGAAIWIVHDAPFGAIGVLWFGGAALTLAFAGLMSRGGAAAGAVQHDDDARTIGDAALASALRDWEQDRLTDQGAAPAQQTR